MTRLTHTISPFAAWARQRRPSSARVEVIFIGAMAAIPGERSAMGGGSVDDWLVHGSAALADVRKRNGLRYTNHPRALSGEPRLEERERKPFVG
jgi:hypothetical protein